MMIDLTGNKYGELEVIEVAYKTKLRKVYWKCLCSCGNIYNIQSYNLRNGKHPSCGCYKFLIPDSPDDLKPGYKNNRLTVIKKTKNLNQSKSYLYECECECGNIVYQSKSIITKGYAKSCGCLRDDKIREQGLKNGGENNGMFGMIRDKHPNWKGEEYREEYDRIRKGMKYKDWRNQVLERDDYKCDICDTGGQLNAHHLVNFSDIYTSELELYKIDNGVTLCVDCHKHFHHIYGVKNNTKEQYEEYKIKI